MKTKLNIQAYRDLIIEMNSECGDHLTNIKILLEALTDAEKTLVWCHGVCPEYMVHRIENALNTIQNNRSLVINK